MTLRTVEHAALGYGLRWNIVERVQVYDDPLWMLVVLAARVLTGESYFTALAVSMLCSLVVFVIVFRQAAEREAALLAAICMSLSPLFVTFSTSGLETPLLHLILVLLMVTAFRTETGVDGLVTVSALAGLAIVTRAPAAWLVVPVVVAMWRGRSTRLRAVSILFVLGPLAGWLVASGWYYGQIGSAGWLADRTADVTWLVRLDLGLRFLAETTRLDPLFAAVVLGGWMAGWMAGGAARAAAFGGLLLTAWTIAHGGSPMAGRDLTVLFVSSLVVLARASADFRPVVIRAAAAAALVLAAAAPIHTYASSAAYGADFRRTTRTHDPRAEDYQATGLLIAGRGILMPQHPESARAREISTSGAGAAVATRAGLFGAGAAPHVYVLDPTGVVDPLLPRLPPAVGEPWLWGAPRRIPDGYLDSLPAGPNRLAEPSLARMYDDVRRITRDPIARGRSVTDEVEQSSYGPARVTLAAISGSSETELVVREGGIWIDLEGRRAIKGLTFTVNRSYDYQIDVLDGDRTGLTQLSTRDRWQEPGVESRHVTFARATEATAVWLRCRRGTGPCTLRHLAIE